jgi:hypothetical protein
MFIFINTLPNKTHKNIQLFTVKECVKVAAKSKDRKKLDSTCALYLCGLMLYAVFKSDPSGVNALIREVLSILRFAFI